MKYHLIFFTLTNNNDTLSTDAFVVRFGVLEPTLVTGTPAPVVDIFPNPVTDELSISFDHHQFQHAEVQLYNASGERIFIVVEDEKRSSKTISMKSLPPGVYLVDVWLDGKCVIRKVIKT